MSALSDGIHQALDLIVARDPVVVHTTARSLDLAFKATLAGAAAGVPAGLVLGVGRFAGRRMLLALANAWTKVAPVLVGVVVLVLTEDASLYGGGPLAGFGEQLVLAQALLAFPIITTLTATAAQSVEPGLLEQAHAFGAPLWRRGLLALREAHAAVLAGVILALGVTLTAVGALLILGSVATVNVNGVIEPTTLATGVVTSYNADQGVAGGAGKTAEAVAFATILFGLFFIIAAGLTGMQHGRRRGDGRAPRILGGVPWST